MKTAVLEEDRTKSFIIYGAAEQGDLDNPQYEAELVFEKVNFSKPYPVIQSSYRIGNKQTGKVRPIKVRLTDSYSVQQVLRNAYKLGTDEDCRDHYLAPDRTKEQRLAHSKLVTEMRRLISEDSSKRYAIRNNRVVCVDNALSQSNA